MDARWNILWQAFCLVEIFYLSLMLLSALVPNYKQHILSPTKVRKVCYSSAELYVKSVYLNLLGWRGREVYETF
jgi:hypothetical protein